MRVSPMMRSGRPPSSACISAPTSIANCSRYGHTSNLAVQGMHAGRERRTSEGHSDPQNKEQQVETARHTCLH